MSRPSSVSMLADIQEIIDNDRSMSGRRQPDGVDDGGQGEGQLVDNVQPPAEFPVPVVTMRNQPQEFYEVRYNSDRKSNRQVGNVLKARKDQEGPERSEGPIELDIALPIQRVCEHPDAASCLLIGCPVAYDSNQLHLLDIVGEHCNSDYGVFITQFKLSSDTDPSSFQLPKKLGIVCTKKNEEQSFYDKKCEFIKWIRELSNAPSNEIARMVMDPLKVKSGQAGCRAFRLLFIVLIQNAGYSFCFTDPIYPLTPIIKNLSPNNYIIIGAESNINIVLNKSLGQWQLVANLKFLDNGENTVGEVEDCTKTINGNNITIPMAVVPSAANCIDIQLLVQFRDGKTVDLGARRVVIVHLPAAFDPPAALGNPRTPPPDSPPSKRARKDVTLAELHGVPDEEAEPIA